MPFHIRKINFFKCDSCGKEAEFSLVNNREVRKYGWAISKDYKRCYCPACKDMYTSVGCFGTPQSWRSGRKI